MEFVLIEETDEATVKNQDVLGYITSLLSVDQGKTPPLSSSSTSIGRVQQLTGRIGRTIGTAYVRQISCWTTFILIQ